MSSDCFVKKADVKAPEVRHEIAHGKLPYDSKPVVRTGVPARTYPFTLDPFQEKAIACIERLESVLVSAHTSAGKTVVAEYAIAQSLKNKQRVIYTSPIKALSNQKYRELQHEFKDVGLMTGDVTLNPSSSCLVMTTEILRSMVYRGNEILREVAWVIFDEIHYMRDKVRGVVWEETIILLPHNVHLVFLSATIPNALEFAEWICDIHQQVCHVVYTDFRPTPLQHYVFPDGAEGIYLVVDENGRFREDNFQQAVSILEQPPNSFLPSAHMSKKGTELTNVYKLIKTLMVKNLNPVIAFAFSKKQCELFARQMSSMDFNTGKQKELIKKVIDNAIELLSEEDRDLPWFQNLLPLLRRGIGVHHSGLIPFMKEIVELLFQEGLIKVLFATETFSMGLNMPAKTVVFCELSKFDGTKSRSITSGEYIQMSGRAGRRGLDTRGFVIMNVDRAITPKDLQEIFKGEADYMSSAFHLKYHMILNISRIEGISPEYMLEHSFYQFQNAAPIPRLKEEISKLEREYSMIEIPQEELVFQYHNLHLLQDEFEKQVRDIIFKPEHCLTYLNRGRLVKVKFNGMDFGWGVIVRCDELVRQEPYDNNAIMSRIRADYNSEEITYKIKVLVKVTRDSFSSYDGVDLDVKPCQPNEQGVCMIIPVGLEDLRILSQFRFKSNVDDLEHDVTQRNAVYKSVLRLISEEPDGRPMDPQEHLNIKDERLSGLSQKLEVIKSQLNQNPTTNSPEIYDNYLKKLKIRDRIQLIQKQLRESELILHLDELKKRKRLLRRLGYLSSNDIVEFKGRVACELTSGDELVLTELLLNGVFNELSVSMTAALLSCFVCDEIPSEPTGMLPQEYNVLFRKVQETAKIIADVTEECNIPIEKDVYLASFSPALMEGNATFRETCARINMFEGNIVRNFRSLDELMRAMISAAKIIGTSDLETKFSEAREKLRRGIIFTASLYL
ncbi:2704_t:CDS:10 [Cetraspora pellucida]|uniref:2704_t:CDS:1 n=2 Tax=Gigasporaceae TaxID=36753 RepID=A0A9N9CS32_9GLOM|nr:2704_t:CDS:10 [Cetraspora pellucida]